MDNVTKNNSITIKNQNSIVFTREQVDLLKNTLAKNATDNELKLFLYQCEKTGLDPFARQIYFIKDNNGKVMIQASIDGLRLVAQRSGEYAGQDEPEWGVTEEKEQFAKISVYKFSKSGERYKAAVGVAFWSEYCPMITDYKTQQKKPSYMWSKMPRTMLAKVAEALALRKAFPQELSGIYTTEEMEQSVETPSIDIKSINENINVDKIQDIKINTIQDAQRKRIFALGKELGYDSETTKNLIKGYFKIESLNDLTLEQAAKVIEKLVEKTNKKYEQVVENTVVVENIEAEEIFITEEDKNLTCYLENCDKPRAQDTAFCSSEHKNEYWGGR